MLQGSRTYIDFFLIIKIERMDPELIPWVKIENTNLRLDYW